MMPLERDDLVKGNAGVCARRALMRRREFLLAAAGGLATILPAFAAVPQPFHPDLWPPMEERADFVPWMAANRGEDPTFLEERFDRYLQLVAFHDLWTTADKRAFLMTPREEFVLRNDHGRAYVDHYLDIGYGVTITPPGTMGRMTSALGIGQDEKVLEIGTGSGCQSAVLSYLTSRVLGRLGLRRRSRRWPQSSQITGAATWTFPMSPQVRSCTSQSYIKTLSYIVAIAMVLRAMVNCPGSPSRYRRP